jgi:hypothetical protein
MKTTIFSGVLRIWLDNWTFVHSLRSFIERSYNGNFEGVPSYPDYSRFGKLLLNTK